MLPVQPTFQAGLLPAAHQRRPLIIWEASTTWGGAAGGAAGPSHPSLPGPPRHFLPAAHVRTKSSLFQFLLRSRGRPNVRVPAHPTLATGACTQVEILLGQLEGGSLVKGTRELICSSSGPSRALNLIFESSSVTKEGSRVTPSRNRPSDKLSSGRPVSAGQTQMSCVDEAAPGASQSARPRLMRSWATELTGRGRRQERGGLLYVGHWMWGKRTHWPGEATRGSQKCTLFPRLRFHEATGRANMRHPKASPDPLRAPQIP